MVKQYLPEIVAWLTAALLAWTGLDKLYHRGLFQYQLSDMPQVWLQHNAGWFSLALPITELLLAVTLLWKPVQRRAFRGTILLFSGFSVFILWMISSGENLPCSCGGIISFLSWKAHLFVNVLMLLLNLLAYHISHNSTQS